MPILKSDIIEKRKKNNLLKSKITLDTEIYCKLGGGPVLKFSLPGGGSHPCPLSLTLLILSHFWCVVETCQHCVPVFFMMLSETEMVSQNFPADSQNTGETHFVTTI